MGKELLKQSIMGMIYHGADGKEIGSIMKRQDFISFIAGRWCRSVSFKAPRTDLLEAAREHERRLRLIWHESTTPKPLAKVLQLKDREG